MRKSKLKDGIPFFGITVEHFVTKRVFANAIASYHWTYDKEFDPKMLKKQAMAILKKNLFLQGAEGLNTDHWDVASEDFLAPFQNAYEAAAKWIDKNYPYLNQ